MYLKENFLLLEIIQNEKKKNYTDHNKWFYVQDWFDIPSSQVFNPALLSIATNK